MIGRIDHVATLIVGPRSLTSCLIGCAHAEVAVRFNHLMMIRLLGETLSAPVSLRSTTPPPSPRTNSDTSLWRIGLGRRAISDPRRVGRPWLRSLQRDGRY